MSPADENEPVRSLNVPVTDLAQPIYGNDEPLVLQPMYGNVAEKIAANNRKSAVIEETPVLVSVDKYDMVVGANTYGGDNVYDDTKNVPRDSESRGTLGATALATPTVQSTLDAVYVEPDAMYGEVSDNVYGEVQDIRPRAGSVLQALAAMNINSTPVKTRVGSFTQKPVAKSHVAAEEQDVYSTVDDGPVVYGDGVTYGDGALATPVLYGNYGNSGGDQDTYGTSTAPT